MKPPFFSTVKNSTIENTTFFLNNNPKFKFSLKMEVKQKILKHIQCFETNTKVRGEMDYLKKHIYENIIKVKYSSNYKHGRTCPDHSLNVLKSNIRLTLSTSNYIDIDMVNSMPNVI